MTDENVETINTDEIKPRKTRKPRKQKVKKRTLIEFKNWFEGFQEFQDDGWIPTLEQWNYIKESVAAIIEEEYDEEYVPSPTHIEPQRHVNHQNTPQIPASSSLDNFSQSVSHNVDIESKLKQDIDTSHGNYVSDFE